MEGLCSLYSVNFDLFAKSFSTTWQLQRIFSHGTLRREKFHQMREYMFWDLNQSSVCILHTSRQILKDIFICLRQLASLWRLYFKKGEDWDTIAIWEARTRVYENMSASRNCRFALEWKIKYDLVLTFVSAIKDMDWTVMVSRERHENSSFNFWSKRKAMLSCWIKEVE